ncbi:MAG: hypothetical protein LC689_09030, partial [Myxococcales bacterium]|nr:hypothetical protein [Myxococcales bacterium]
EKHTISAAGSLGAASTGGATGIYFEIITDGTNLFDWRSATNNLNSRNANLGNRWAQGVTPSGAPAMTLEGTLLVPLSGGAVATFQTANPGTAVKNPLLNLGASGHAPLIGWDGQQAHEHFYLTRDTAVFLAYDSAGNLSWEADPNGSTYRTATMDCLGRVFSASNGVNGSQSLVYALITDDRGMADTAWPSYRIDARNTGNAASAFGMLPSGGTCSQ